MNCTLYVRLETAWNVSSAGPDGWVSQTDLYRALGNVRAERLHAVLAELVAAGSVEGRTTGTGARPLSEWRLASGSPDSHFADSQNCAGGGAQFCEPANSQTDPDAAGGPDGTEPEEVDFG